MVNRSPNRQIITSLILAEGDDQAIQVTLQWLRNER